MPQKSRPGTIALAAVPFLIPLLASGLLAARWYHSQSLIETEQAVLHQNQQHIEQNLEDLQQYESMQQQILQARHDIKNITETLRFELPASPVLQELVQALPPGVILNKLDLDYTPIRRKDVNPQNNLVVYNQVVQRTLRLTLAGPNRIESDQAVDSYIQALRSSPALTRVAQEIRITAKQEMEMDKQIMVLYEIKCPLIEQK